jgi:hypothetical protein
MDFKKIDLKLTCLVADAEGILTQPVLHLSAKWTLTKPVLSSAFMLSFYAHAHHFTYLS